jgi:hypothetical protein
MAGLYFIPGAIIPADIVSKRWDYLKIWHLLQALLFWKGDTALVPADNQMHYLFHQITQFGITHLVNFQFMVLSMIW